MQSADIFIVIGSTLSVYPVAGLVHEISDQCKAYYIDPQADHVRVPQQYELLKMSATQGMHELFKNLTN
ncbi:NAD-dependent deacetylase [compost metagenome]